MSILTPENEALILRTFRVSALRTGQRQLIESLISGHNALGVLPTGHGKSLCYQATAILLPGTTLVVSPLIALMQDQCSALASKGIAAARYDSTLTEEERDELLQRLTKGAIRLLFVAPESLESKPLLKALQHTQLSLFVVDEAHCVSEWGHSFRPDYLNLPAWQQRFPFTCTLALTATATPRVREDLQRAFHIEPKHEVVLPPDRPNIHRRVLPTQDRHSSLLHLLKQAQYLPAIVYCRTRKDTENLTTYLQQQLPNTPIACYHAGISAEQRATIQEDFLHNRTHILVATIAFGMGIDKPDVRSVIHFCAPSSPEAYLQESGRAGRDGATSTSVVLLDPDDIRDARNRILAAEPDAEGVIRCVRWMLPASLCVVSSWELTTTCDIPDDTPQRILKRLQAAQAITEEARGYQFYKVRPLFPLSTILDGRDKEECARLQWLDQHREGEIIDAAFAWDISYTEAMAQLDDCLQSGEWRVTYRRRAICLQATGNAVQARPIAEEISQAYQQRTQADLARLDTLLNILTGRTCINLALHQYFMGELPASPPCGTCSPCQQEQTALPLAKQTMPTLPAPEELPPFDRDTQRKRFLLGISSPALLSRRLWAHPHYGCCADARWEDL